MLAKAKSRYIRVSPNKLRPIADVIRGCTVEKALAFLKTHGVARVKPVQKLVESAFANAKNLHSDVASESDLLVKEIRVDQGPTIKYFKPAAMGRASVQRKRLSHIEVVLGKK
jgi:large subunit ribosomal protein L22